MSGRVTASVEERRCTCKNAFLSVLPLLAALSPFKEKQKPCQIRCPKGVSVFPVFSLPPNANEPALARPIMPPKEVGAGQASEGGGERGGSLARAHPVVPSVRGFCGRLSIHSEEGNKRADREGEERLPRPPGVPRAHAHTVKWQAGLGRLEGGRGRVPVLLSLCQHSFGGGRRCRPDRRSSNNQCHGRGTRRRRPSMGPPTATPSSSPPARRVITRKNDGKTPTFRPLPPSGPFTYLLRRDRVR